MNTITRHVSVDAEAIRNLGATLRGLELAPTFRSTLTPPIRGDREACLRSALWASAICHSTKGGLRGTFDGTIYRGWDFLIHAFMNCAQIGEAVAPQNIARCTREGLKQLLIGAASDAVVTLDDLERRAAILQEAALQLEQQFSGAVSSLLDLAANRVGGESGAYAQLNKLTAFQDPLRKKSSAFLMTISFAGLWNVTDQENIEPMIDYHRIRLLCRMGCLRVNEEDLRRKLIEQKPVALAIEEELRRASTHVFRALVPLTGLGMFECDTLLWAHARSCCRHSPLCAGGRLEAATFYSMITKKFSNRCEFQEWCAGASDSEVRSIWEPAVQTENY